MAGQSVAYFARRARRRIVADLPDDLDDTDDSDIMDVCRGRVHASLAASARREEGLPPHARRATLGLPASPPSTRRSNGRGQRPFHLGFARPGHARSAAEDDAYASEKDTREQERAAQHDRDRDRDQDIGLELPPADDDDTGAAKARDAYTVKDQAKVAVLYTNLDPDAAPRQAQWDELVAHERKVLAKSRSKGVDRINIYVARSQELAEAVAAHPQCPAPLRDRIDAALAGEKPGRSGVAWVDADAARTHTWIRTLSAWEVASTDARKALRHSPGRVVDDHDFVEVELPAALDAAGRANVVRRVGDLLRSLPGRADSHDARCQVPFVIVEHAPDALNDARNSHFHLVRGKRRVLIGADGQLVRDDDGDIVAEEHRVPAICALHAIKTFRGQIAGIVNDELVAARARERVHPGTYKEMAIDAVPMIKLGNAETVLNRAGVRTIAAYDNAEEGWRRVFADIDAAYEQGLRAADEHYRNHDDRMRETVRNGAVGEALRRHIAHASALRHEAAALERDARYIETYATIARSSMTDPVKFADAYADAKAKAGASRYDVDGWRKRGAEARAFLTGLDAELGEEQAAIVERRRAAQSLQAQADFADATFAANLEAALVMQSNPTVVAGEASEPIAPTIVVADDTKSAAASDANATDSSAHRIIDRVERTPLLLSREGDRYFVAANDDDARVRAGRFDLNVRGADARLARIHRCQSDELATVNAHLVKHGDRLSTADYVAELQNRWVAQPAYARLVEKAKRLRVTAASSSPVSDRGASTPDHVGRSMIPAGAPTDVARAVAPADAYREYRRAHSEAEFERNLGVLLGDRMPTRLAGRAIDANQRNPPQAAAQFEPGYYPSLAEQHALFLACPTYRERAEKLAAGDARTAAEIARALAGPDTDWVVKVGDRIDYSAHVKTVRSERLANLIDYDLSLIRRNPPPLTRATSGEVGIHDDKVLRRTHHNHVGLRLPKPQGVLVGLFLRQEIEQESAAERAISVPGSPNAGAARSSDAAGSSDVAVRVWRRAIAQNENGYVLAFVGEQLVSGDRSSRAARLAELSDEEKRKLKRQIPWHHAQFVYVPLLPRPSGKVRGRKGQRKREGKSVAD